MVSRRGEVRRPRRLQLRFWHSDTSQPFPGFTTNVSLTGMFIATNHPAKPGTRLRVEVSARGRAAMLEAVTVHAQRAPPAMQAIQQSGMGVRFLQIAELIGELIPEIAANPAAERTPLPDGAYTVVYRDRRQLVDAIERDMVTGGLFVPTEEPAELGAMVTVELRLEGLAAPTVRFQARVVQRLDRQTPAGASNLLAGMGVEMVDPERTLAEVRALAASARFDRS